MRNKFDREIADLNEEIIKMGEFIEQAIKKAMQALRDRDFDLAKEVAESDYLANELERSIEKKSLRILLSEQPVASDLRKISTALRMITDMERICDQAADIAEIILSFENHEDLKTPNLIMKMSEECVIMTSRAIQSFVNSDLDLAKKVVAYDDEIDKFFLEIRSEIVEIIKTYPQYSSQALDFFMITKYLERIGDHAQNIAEWVIFNITGKRKNQRIL